MDMKKKLCASEAKWERRERSGRYRRIYEQPRVPFPLQTRKAEREDFVSLIMKRISDLQDKIISSS